MSWKDAKCFEDCLTSVYISSRHLIRMMLDLFMIPCQTLMFGYISGTVTFYLRYLLSSDCSPLNVVTPAASNVQK